MKEINLNSNPRILITRTDRIGDLVLSTAVFPVLRRRFPSAWIACLTFIQNREILEGNPYLDEVILYDKKGSEKGWPGNFRFARKLAAKKFDCVIHLHATNRMHVVSWLAGIPARIGWDRKSSWALTHRFPDIKSRGEKHEAEYNFDLLSPLGVNAPQELETYFPVKLPQEEALAHLFAHQGLDPGAVKILFSPSASCPSKIWPAERFGYLAQKIAEKYPDAMLIAVGSHRDRALVQKMTERADAPIVDLSGKLTLGMLGALMKNSALLISNDSGPVHIASALGTPVISIFGRNQPGLSPRRWRPLGKNSRYLWKDVGCVTCLAHDCQIHFLCLDVISAAEVFAEVEKFSGIFSRQPSKIEMNPDHPALSSV